jgi:hypothetical protein
VSRHNATRSPVARSRHPRWTCSRPPNQ